MKLNAKLTLFSTISKLVIVLLFTLALPRLVNQVAFRNTDYLLKQQEKKVLSQIEKNGIDFYLEGDTSYGSYTMLKEEYVALELAKRDATVPETIMSAKRIVEGDTILYRLLNKNFEYDHKTYSLEIGKTIVAIQQYNRPLQRIAFTVLGVLVLLTLMADFGFTQIILRPLKKIIRTKIVNPDFSSNSIPVPVRTSTKDFKYLDESLIALMKRIKDDFEREKEFTSNASHELLTPVTLLQTKLENLMLTSGQDETLQQRILEMMKTVTRLKKIVNSLLLISRIENNQYVKTEKVNIRKMLEEISEELAERMESRSIQFFSVLKQEIEIPRMNYDLIYQLFYNLLTNAIRYNKTGGMIRLSDTIGRDGKYCIVIEDSGIGIDPAEIENIFDRFKKSAVNNEGNGLGLSIVKSIANYNKIKISVNSDGKSGTTFIIQFPLFKIR